MAPGAGEIFWGLSTTADMSNVIAANTVEVGPDADWTAKVLVEGLDADTDYFTT